MKTTDYQVAILDRLADGTVVEVRSPASPTRRARFWIDEVPIDPRSLRLLLRRGWVAPTRKPGGKKLTGRLVITRLGRAALRRSR